MTSVWRECVRTAWLTLRANRLRSALTTLTVGLGAATMALLVSLATNALATILTGVDAVGGREIIFLDQKDSTGNQAQTVSPLTSEDANALRSRVPGIRDVEYLMSMRDQPILAEGHKLDVDVAMGAAYPYLLQQEFIAGSLFRDDDRQRSVVLTEPIATQLFGAPERAMGKGVVLWQERYVVTGVTREKPAFGFNMGGVSSKRAVFIASAAALHSEGMDPRGFIVLRAGDDADHDLAMADAASILRYRHHGADDVTFFDMRAFLRSFDLVFAGIRVVVGLIAAVSLVIAGAGIMNVMLASIRQRVTEIGIRRAVGASQADIRRQFLVESVMIAVFGGIVGSAIGTGLAAAIGAIVHYGFPAWKAAPSFTAAIVAAIAAGAGFIFGIRPAQRASGMWIVECLRGVGG